MTTGQRSDGSMIAHYNRLAASYDVTWTHSPEFLTWMTGALRARLAPAVGERAMDLGCGTGLYTSALAVTERPITVVDPSLAMLTQLLRRAGQGRVLPVCATAEEIASRQEGVPETAYELILAKEALHHVAPDQRATVVAGVSRLLAPGGRFLVAMLPQQTGYPLWPAARERFTRLQPDPADIARAMEAAGLSAEVSVDEFPLSFPRGRYLGMLRSRFMSLLADFDDTEIDDGIAQMLQEHGDGDQIRFTDRFAFVLGCRAA